MEAENIELMIARLALLIFTHIVAFFIGRIVELFQHIREYYNGENKSGRGEP